MMGVSRTLFPLSVFAGLYASFVCESMCEEPSIAPQLPLLFSAMIAMSASQTSGVVIAAMIGLGCDALSAGRLGPMMIGAAALAFISHTFSRRDRLPLSAIAVLIAASVGGTLALGAVLGSVLEHRPFDLQQILWMAAARGVTSAVVGVMAVVTMRSLRLMQRLATVL
jgi:rod shape-determining protein MreD